MSVACLAPAKVNLFLHVGGPASDGFHPICSAMVFADVGDLVTLAEEPGLTVSGPFAGGIEGSDNLVSRAVAAIAPHLPGPVGLHLEKRLPVAAGLGGGSSDAGAALRLLRSHFARQVTDAELEALAAGLGSDGAACLWGRTVLAQGRGERLSAWAAIPEIFAVLVNPGIPVSTPGVYRRFDDLGISGDVAPPTHPAAFASAVDLADWLKARTRNDLQAPALSLAPGIQDVLSELGGSNGVLMARMSGSGATCFALCADKAAAEALAGKLAVSHPHWWVQACAFS